ncbi:MAG TPA: arsenic resistance protein [Pseudogracilibacillus sp.]|nr:arsenic resistance protein [Pseudogracilibacillus sp.]
MPLVLLLGFLIGSYFDTSFLQPTLLIATIIMIYATMIGFNFNELTSLKGTKVLLYSILINFLIIPLVAYLLGISLLENHPLMFAGLALSALLPTSGMTISWTVLQRGNVGASVKMTIFGLIIGSILTPWYLLLMVGHFVEIDVFVTMRTILFVVFVPMLFGQITYKLILLKTTKENFKKNIKPNFGPLSIWAMLYVVFVSISTKASMITNNLSLIWTALIVLIIFYLLNFIISTFFAIKFFNREDGIALVNGTVLRNLSIAIGIAATSFGAEAALIVTLAFVVQQQGIVNYAKIAMPRWFQLKNN